MGHIKMTKRKDQDCIFGRTVIFTKEILSMIIDQGLGKWFGRMEAVTRGTGVMGLNKD